MVRNVIGCGNVVELCGAEIFIGQGLASINRDSPSAIIRCNHSQRIASNDGGGTVSVDGGKTWTDEDFITTQFYHVTTTNHVPYHVAGAQQDNSTKTVP